MTTDFKLIPEDKNGYYIIHMNKSIEKFNLVLDLLKCKDLFYEFLTVDDIPLDKDIVELVFEENGFYIEDSLFYHNDLDRFQLISLKCYGEFKRIFVYDEPDKIQYTVEHGCLSYSDQFDIKKISDIIGLIGHCIGNDIEVPEDNPSIEESDFIWDLDLNSGCYEFEFREKLDCQFFQKQFQIYCPINDFIYDESGQGTNVRIYEYFPYLLKINPVVHSQNLICE